MKAAEKRFIEVLAIVILLTLAKFSFAADFYKSTADLFLRTGPGSKYKYITVIKKGDTVNLIDKSISKWFKVGYKEKSGFVSSKYLELIVVESKAEITNPPIEEDESDSNAITYIVIGALIIIVFIVIITLGKKRRVNPVPVKPTMTISNSDRLKENINKQPERNFKITITMPNTNSEFGDESIIDVTGNSYHIEPDGKLKKFPEGVPYWAHQYVYSYSEIHSATQEQRTFYDIYKRSFIDGEYFDLEGNTNYAFILLFDLYADFENHRDLVRLEKQFDALGINYPKTKPYARNFLLDKMEKCGDMSGVERLRQQSSNSYSNYPKEYIDNYHLGNKYGKKLNLTHEEISWLNKFWDPNNAFTSIEGCCIETIRFYLAIIKKLVTLFDTQGSSFDKIFSEFQSEYIRVNKLSTEYSWGGFDVSYVKSRVEYEVYGTIFKRAENTLRDVFGHKRKISIDFPNSNQQLKQNFESTFGTNVDFIIQSLLTSINLPDEKTEIELNTQNINRWRIAFEGLCATYDDQSIDEFVRGIHALEKANLKNPSIEHIFFEASKFISKHDKIASLKFYMYYLYYDLKSVKIDNKQLAKTIQKNLFKNNDQINEFERIVAELVRTKDINKAIAEVPKIYEPKRKKITLDETTIKKVQQQDKGTVEILNEYLKDEFEDEHTNIKTEEINNYELKIEIIDRNEKVVENPFSIPLNPVQTEAIVIFADNAYNVSHEVLETYCRSKNVFISQLIDSINEACYETLDDVLIEEDGEAYIINAIYYDKIITK